MSAFPARFADRLICDATIDGKGQIMVPLGDGPFAGCVSSIGKSGVEKVLN